MARVIFLDIDGVLNSNLGNDPLQGEISNGSFIDEKKIKLLASLIETTNAQIILHSGWRFWFDSKCKPLCKEAEKLMDLLHKNGLQLNGFTPDLTTEEIRKNKKFSLVKADEILSWLNAHKNVTKWVVLDDLDLHNTQIEQHQVKPDPAVGLTLENIRQAEEILTAQR